MQQPKSNTANAPVRLLKERRCLKLAPGRGPSAVRRAGHRLAETNIEAHLSIKPKARTERILRIQKDTAIWITSLIGFFSFLFTHTSREQAYPRLKYSVKGLSFGRAKDIIVLSPSTGMYEKSHFPPRTFW